ncbi:aspartate aminotransferase AatA (plasmid) [Phaeobacter piscinae]|uniref:Aminotransferase n=1 Tax=Phaeobacter piscinae TaxID=1580596 RepID=A0ABN5DKD1_9RHOB|nr:aminotransferase class I/II-fold pyridoxal phosphate-dependent enzyme [Phaeobacter piscinae]ATG37939.1 aspartate aminotransferase AatA [Phaeobacter piscinae]AUQ88460.1 aspartate aminotransferase AatA [Phaeobacter piscinae]AUR26343.1 aspartate aminotransferase AatA [Phaeobacter piscinae]
MPDLATDHRNTPFCPILELAGRIQARGKPVVDFSIGVPNFTPPQRVYDAAIAAIHADQCRYGPSRGEAGLIAAYLHYLTQLGQDQFGPESIAVGQGGKHLLYSLFQVLFEPGDTVVIPAPCWPTYFDIARLSGVAVRTPYCGLQQGYKLDPATLEAALGGRVVALVLNNPSNPSGALYSRAELAALAAVLRRHDVWIISDDVYQRFVYTDEQCPHLLDIAPDLAPRIIKVDSISKLYGMPGWRAGLLAAAPEVAEAVTVLNSNSISNMPPMVAAAAAEALGGDQGFSQRMTSGYRARRDLLLTAFDSAPQIRCARPGGAFYLFPDISRVFGSMHGTQMISTDEDLCNLLLDSYGVAAVPGRHFGAPDNIRLSYAIDVDQVRQGASQILRCLAELKERPKAPRSSPTPPTAGVAAMETVS